MKTLLSVLIAGLFLIGFTHVDSEIDGTWIGEVSGPNGQMKITYHFNTEGDTLTGTVETGMGEMEIVNGKVAGDKFSFETKFNNATITHKCELKDENTIAMEFTFEGNGPGPGGPQTMTLTRQEED